MNNNINILFSIFNYFPFFIIIFVLFLILIKKLKINFLTVLLIFYCIFLLIQGTVYSLNNYFLWKNNSVSQRLLPPFTPITYFLRYSFIHYFAASIISLIFALIIFYSIKRLNQRFNKTFFYDEEPYLAALGILTTGWPNCLIYLSLVLFLGVVSHFIYALNTTLRRTFKLERMIQGRDINVNALKGKVSEAPFLQMSASLNFRLSLFYFWLPCALLTLFLSDIISKYLGITQLSI